MKKRCRVGTRTLLTVVLVALLFSAFTTQVAANLNLGNYLGVYNREADAVVDNGRFENPISSNDWVVESGSPYRDSSLKRNGAYSLRMTMSESWVVLRQDVDASSVSEIKAINGQGTQTIEFRFWFCANDDEWARAQIELYYDGQWHTPIASQWIEGFGDIWTEVGVSTTVEDKADLMIRLRIYVDDWGEFGAYYTKAWIDDADVTVRYSEKLIATYGDVSLAYSILYVCEPVSGTKQSRLSLAISAQSKPVGGISYFVQMITIVVYLYPYSGGSTTQNGDYSIKEFGSANDKNIAKYPAGSLEDDLGLLAAKVGLAVATGLLITGLGAVAIIDPPVVLLAVAVAAAGTTLLFEYLEEQMHGDSAADGGSDYYTSNTWDYTSYTLYSYPVVPVRAAATEVLLWEYEMPPDYEPPTIGLLIVGTITWCKIGFTFPYWYTQTVGTTSISDYVTVSMSA